MYDIAIFGHGIYSTVTPLNAHAHGVMLGCLTIHPRQWVGGNLVVETSQLPAILGALGVHCLIQTRGGSSSMPAVKEADNGFQIDTEGGFSQAGARTRLRS